MNDQRSVNLEPFRCYVGRRINCRDRPHVVEGCEVHGRDLLFRLRPLGPGSAVRLTVVELLALVEAEERGDH